MMTSSMDRPLWLWLVLLAILSTVQAQTPPVLDEGPRSLRLTFDLSPSSAQVWRRSGEGQLNFVGLAGVPLTLGLSPQESSGRRDLIMEYRVPLWSDTWVSEADYLPVAQALTQRLYVKRLPLSGWQRFQAQTRAHPYPWLAVLAGVGLWAWKRSRSVMAAEAGPVEDYRLGPRLGAGGMGEVFQAVRAGSQEQVALKFLRSELCALEEFRERFDAEIQIQKELSHPHLVRLLGYGVNRQGQVYLVSELLQGNTLKKVLEDADFDPPGLAAEVLEQIGSALDYLHAQQIVHRDVKPANIFVSWDGRELKLLDLGIASVGAPERQYQHQGTIAYMAPEQYRDRPEPASDQYALGLVIYEVLTGRRPFTATEPSLLAHQHAERPVPSPRELEPRLSVALESALLRMLSKSPSDRYPDLRAAREALTDHLIELGLKWAPEENAG